MNYTTAQLLALLADLHGIKAQHSYINRVILRTDRTPLHPLYHARLGTSEWDGEKVDRYAHAWRMLNKLSEGK